jgi:mannan endo-1,4-beta-mannosidase
MTPSGTSRRRRVPTRVLTLTLGCVLAAGVLPAVVAAASTSFIPIGLNTGDAAFDPAGTFVYAVDGDHQAVVVIDRATRTVLGRVTIPGVGSTDIAIDPATGDALMLGGASEIEVVSGATLSLGSPISIPIANGQVYRLAVSALSGRGYAAVQVPGASHQPATTHLVAFDLHGSGPVVDVATIPGIVINKLVVADAEGRVYGATSNGVIAFDATTLAQSTIPIAGGSLDLAFDPSGHRLYSIKFDTNQPATIIDTSSESVIGALPGSGDGWAVGVDPTRDRVFVARTGRLQVFEGGVETQTIPLRGQLGSIRVDPTTGDVWVNGSYASSGGLWVLDLAPGGTPRSGFVTRVGNDLVLDGTPYRFTGVNIYNANSDGWCREAIDDATLDSSLDSIGLSWSGHGVIRAWFFQTLATDDATGARDWSRFDRLLRMAAERGYKVIPTLADQWGECGARVAPTYAYKTEAWYTGGYAAPDPALAAAHGGSWLSYRDWVAQIVGRYKDDPTVAFWQLMNEAEVNPAGAFGACPPGDGPRDTLIDFATDMSGLVKSIDHDHLLSLGTIGGGQCGTSGPQYKDVHAIPDIDLCEYHDYTPNQAIPGDQSNGLGQRIQQCAELGKPLVIGETGIRPIDVGGTLEDRAASLRSKIQTQTELGVDGIVAWNYSPAGSTLDDYDIGPGDPALQALEPLTDRPAYVVTTTDDVDDGFCTETHCSLREAIERTNNGPLSKNLIRFAIPGPAPHVIKPITPLPVISRRVLIDGTSQPDFAGVPTVVLSGVDGPVTDGLTLNAFNSAVRGLVINGFGKASIRVGDGDALITGNRIGTSADGSVAVRHPSGRADVGILVQNDRVQIGGVTGGDPNTIAGNDDGIVVGGQDSRIIGNLIGTDPSGSPGAGNGSAGVRITAALRITVGGVGLREGNTISGSGGAGVAIVDDFSIGNIVTGNSIHDNGGLGIDLDENGPDRTPPTAIDQTGPNRSQPRPIVDDVAAGVITGRAWGAAGSVTLEFFASPTCDPAGSGEGTRFIGSTRVTATGTTTAAAFSFTPDVAPAAGEVVTATTTSAVGTSEFSPCWPAPPSPGDTPVGTAVVSAPVDGTTGGSPVQVTFANVTTAGVTSLATSDTGPTVPAGFTLGDPPTYFDIATSATFNGQIQVCINYAGIAYIDPAALRLYHFDSSLGAWADATSSVDTTAQRVCGVVTSLSPFALVQRAPTFTTASATSFTIGTNGSFTIRTSGFLHPTLSVSGGLPAGISFTDRHDGTATLAGVATVGSGGVYPITVVGTEAGLQVSQQFTITVREAPAFTSPANAIFTVGAPGSFQVLTRGYPAPALTRTGALPNGLTFATATGVLTGTPATGTVGTYKVTLRATNGVGAAVQQTLTITVAKRASAVTATCAPDPVVPGNATTCTATVTDSSAGAKSAPTASVTWSIVSGAGKMSAASCRTQGLTRLCTVTYTPGLTQTIDQRLRASYPGDASHGPSTADVVNRLIVTSADTYATHINSPLTVGAPGVISNDRNVIPGTAALVAGPLHGVLTLRSDGSFTYTPSHAYHGKDGFLYRVRVGTVWSLPAVVTINVG